MMALLARDLKLAFRVGGGALTGVLFFLVVITIVPFGIGPDLNLLAKIGPAMLWIAALLASLLGLDRLFQQDREDGTLDLIIMQPYSMATTVFHQVHRALVGQWPSADYRHTNIWHVHEYGTTRHRCSFCNPHCRHSSHYIHRSSWCSRHRIPTAWRIASRRFDIAIGHPHFDIRRQRIIWCHRRPRSIHITISHFVCTDVIFRHCRTDYGRMDVEKFRRLINSAWATNEAIAMRRFQE